MPYSPGGLAQLDRWGASRYAANTAWIALVYSDYLREHGLNPKGAATYHRFARSQIDYLLGDNPMGHPLQIGLMPGGPTKPHHRASHGSINNDINSPRHNEHLLIGALVGGPSDGDHYEDRRDNYIHNETTVDYNAGFTSALARLFQEYGGEPIAEADFPPPESVRHKKYLVQD